MSKRDRGLKPIALPNLGRTSAPGARYCFRVTIFYQEPTYALSRNQAIKTYDWTYKVHASGSSEAKRLAIDTFKRDARLSGSGWGREIVNTEVHAWLASHEGGR